jgi:hypothetical protein
LTLMENMSKRDYFSLKLTRYRDAKEGVVHPVFGKHEWWNELSSICSNFLIRRNPSHLCREPNIFVHQCFWLKSKQLLDFEFEEMIAFCFEEAWRRWESDLFRSDRNRDSENANEIIGSEMDEIRQVVELSDESISEGYSRFSAIKSKNSYSIWSFCSDYSNERLGLLRIIERI